MRKAFIPVGLTEPSVFLPAAFSFSACPSIHSDLHIVITQEVKDAYATGAIATRR